MSKVLTLLQATGLNATNAIIVISVLAACILAPRLFERLLAGLRAVGAFTDRHAGFAILCAAAIPLTLRLLVLTPHPIPEPSIHDEFSYLLAADTFAQGRVTNPPHPLFQFFETIHVLPQPTYMSKYPPLQGLLLAAGQVLFGHPWWGEFASMGLMVLAAGWMLLGWLPGRWAALGALALGLQFGVGHAWMNSYWGGAPAAIGASIFLGAFARLRAFRVQDANLRTHTALAALGIVLLLNSRPWEGLAVVVAASLTALPWMFEHWRALLPPAAAVIGIAAAGMLYYNARITGNPLRMPYTTIHQTYSVAPLFVWQQRTPDPIYRHASMQRFYLQAEPRYQDADQVSTFRGWLSLQPSRWRMAKDLLFGNFFLLLSLPVLLWPGSAALRLPAVALVVFMIALGLESWNQIHYFGPVIGLAALVKLASLDRISTLGWGRRPIGAALALAIGLCAAVRSAEAAMSFTPPDAFALQRAQLLRELEAKPGQHVVMVRYDASQPPSEEWVYNHAHIDSSKVVWARDMNARENEKLFHYFHGRTFWLLEPGAGAPKLTPLEVAQ